MVKNCPRPFTPTDIRGFFGLAVCYRTFIDGFSSIACPLKALTQKKVNFPWLENCQKGFHEFKYKLTSSLVLTLKEVNEGFVLYCDAFRVGLGSVLMHHYKVIAYASIKLIINKKNCSTHDLELVAVVFALKRSRHYL